MSGTGTEAESAHPACVGDLVPNLLQHNPGSIVVSCVQRIKGGHVVRTTLPDDVSQIRTVMDPEVVKGAQQVLIKGIPEPELSSRTAIEERSDVDAVTAFRRCGKT
jgi:hypothetical protein